MSNVKKESPLDNQYPFQFIEDEIPHYVFQIETGVQYEVKFKPSPYIFPSSLPFSQAVFEFSIILGYKPPGNPKIASDKFIPITVVAIFSDFYNRYDDTKITIYICDSSDYKQHVRKRKFDQWFDEYNDGSFVKLTEEIKDTDGTKYPVAIIMKRINIYRTQIFEAFINLVDGYNDGK